jgi:bifunctional non-homologous end joining protein LigD
MKCKSVSAVPKGHWMIELKLDGFRALAVKRGSKVELISRNHKFLSHRFPQLLEGLARLPWPKLTLDGEIVALDAQGRPSFQSLQDGGRAGRVVYYAFDILNFEGRALTQLPFEDRRFVLEHVLAEVPENIRLSARFDGPVYEVVRAVKAHGLEGIVCKAPGSIYEVGVRSGAWIKYKTLREQEFVIGGYTAPQGARQAFGALLVGYYHEGRLLFASKVGTGFKGFMLRTLFEQFQHLVRKKCPFVNLPESGSGRWGEGLTASEMRNCVWVEPILVCQVGFTEWTLGGHLRHPVFKGMRLDKGPKDVVREL